jgi:integrase/recombinase XerD
MWIQLCYPYLSSINSVVKNLPSITYSKTYKSWLVPLSKENYKTTFYSLQSIAKLDTTEMKIWFTNTTSIKNDRAIVATKPRNNFNYSIESNNAQVTNILKLVIAKLHLKAYSLSTQKSYVLHLKEYLNIISLKYNPSQVDQDTIEKYLLWRLKEKQSSESDANSHINAIKFYYEQVLDRHRMLFDLPRPKSCMQLPKVLASSELSKLFNALINKKHKAILFTAYSAGLRVSEVCRLKQRDIDSQRMQIFIENAKGKKDRYVTLSPILLDVLRRYIQLSHPRPLLYLFEGMHVAEPYNVRTAQRVFQLAKIKAGIKKTVSFHSLRHSFATHLLEKGIDIKYIKDILGHFDIKTTERYLHVSKEKLVNITSPLDDLWENGYLD